MSLACRLCIATNGLRGADLATLPDNESASGGFAHLEAVHHLIVRRQGEDEATAEARFLAEHPEARIARPPEGVPLIGPDGPLPPVPRRCSACGKPMPEGDVGGVCMVCLWPGRSNG